MLVAHIHVTYEIHMYISYMKYTYFPQQLLVSTCTAYIHVDYIQLMYMCIPYSLYTCLSHITHVHIQVRLWWCVHISYTCVCVCVCVCVYVYTSVCASVYLSVFCICPYLSVFVWDHFLSFLVERCACGGFCCRNAGLMAKIQHSFAEMYGSFAEM